MTWLIQFAATLAGRLSIVGIGLASLIAVYKATEYKGVQKERARQEKEALANDAKAQPARRSAERDARRVLKQYERD
jgi:hypothetical protein